MIRIILCAVVATGTLYVGSGPSRAAKPPITAVVFAPDGQRVVAGSQSGIQVFSWPALGEQRTLETGLQNVHALAFSPDGKRLLAGGGTPGERGTVELYDWPAADRLATREDHGDLVYGVAWRPDSSGWITAGLDRVLRVYDRHKRMSLRELAGHSRGVQAVGVLPNGDTVLSGGRDNSLRVWSLQDGTVLRSFNNHTQPVHDLAVRPQSGKDALPMVVTASDDRTVRLWQPTIGRMVRFHRLETAVPLRVRWTPDGSAIVVACSDGHLRVIDPGTVEVLQETGATSGWAYALAVHPDGREVLVGGTGGVIKRVQLTYGKRR